MKVKLLVAVALAALIGSVQPASVPASDTPTIYDVLARRENLAVLFIAVTEAKEISALKSQEKQLTLFAPTDDAFAKLDDATIKKIATDQDFVRKLVLAHVVDGKLTTTGLTERDGKVLTTHQGSGLKVEKLADGFRIGGAKVVVADIMCSNGVIHVVDTVLPPGR